MAQNYNLPRTTDFLATDEIQTVQYRKSSRKFSEIKLGLQPNSSGFQLLESLKPEGLDGEKEKGSEEDFIFKEEYYSPEGVWGWVIVLAAFCTNFIVDGISLSYSVLNETLTTPKNITAKNGTVIGFEPSGITETQYQSVGSILLGLTLVMGPFASILAEKLGFRPTAMLGSVIATIGIFSSLCISPTKPTFAAFLIGFGIITGIGFGILFTVSVVIVGLYFSENRALATGITVAGTGVGTLTMAPLTNWILKLFGWRGAVIFQGCICASSFFMGCLYREIPKKVVKIRKSEAKRPEGNMPVKEQLKGLLTSPSYLIVCISGSFIMMGFYAPFGFVPDSAAAHILRDDAVNLLSVLGATNAIGRVFFGFMANKIGHSLHISNVALTVGGLVTCAYPFATTHAWLILCAVVFGLYSAVFASLRSIIIMDIVGEEKFNVGFGLSLLFMGGATFFSNYVGALLKAKTENYDLSFYAAGCSLILSAVICYPLPCINQWEKKRESGDDPISSQQRKSLIEVQVANS